MSAKTTVKLNYLRIAPRKVRFITELIKGLPVNEAEAQLLMHRRRPSQPILKLLRSAVAAAKNAKLSVDSLQIESIRVDQGPMLKRSLPRARGMATPLQKKMSHVTLTLAENPALGKGRFTILPKEKKIKKEAASKKKARPAAEKETPAVETKKKESFFKRTFRRKAI